MVKLQISLGIRTTSMLILILMFIISGCTHHYIAFGDSITKGFGDDEGEGYPPKLSKMLSSCLVRYKIHKKGQLGEDSNGGRKRIEEILEDSDYQKVTIILIQFGTNDTRSDDTHPVPTTVATFKENLQEIIDRVKAAGKSPLLAKIPVMYAECMRPQSCEPFDDLNTAEYNERISEYNEAIDQLVWANRLEIEEGCLLIPPDFYAYFESTGRDSLGKSTEFSDNWHPNRAGITRWQSYGKTRYEEMNAGVFLTVIHVRAETFVNQVIAWTGFVVRRHHVRTLVVTHHVELGYADRIAIRTRYAVSLAYHGLTVRTPHAGELDGAVKLLD